MSDKRSFLAPDSEFESVILILMRIFPDRTSLCCTNVCVELNHLKDEFLQKLGAFEEQVVQHFKQKVGNIRAETRKLIAVSRWNTFGYGSPFRFHFFHLH